MSSPLAVKRRRLHDATNTLAKPFVSPLRKSSATKVPLNANRNAVDTAPYTPSTLAHTTKASVSPESPPRKTTTKPAVTRINRSTPVRKQAIASLTSKRTDPAVVAAQKAINSLELKLIFLRNDIDTLTQAHKLHTTSTDSELEDLAHKWKLASQQAAEELFGTVKERVNCMGGVQAWRESERQKYERANGLGEFGGQEDLVDDDADCEFDSQGEELPEEEVEWRKSQKRKARQEAEDAADVHVGGEDGEVEDRGGRKQVWMEQDADDDSFTMDMMLRSLNIDLEVIGYEKDAQRWIT